jgi:hypothetical protein
VGITESCETEVYGAVRPIHRLEERLTKRALPFLFLQDLVRDGIRKGAIRDIDWFLLICMMASSLSGLIAQASATGAPAERKGIIEEGWILSGTD